MGFSIIFPLFPNILKYYFEENSNPIWKTLIYLLNAEIQDSGSILIVGGILGSVYSILQFLFSPIWGRMSDRLGRRKILIFTTTGNFLGYLVWALSSDFTFFLISRVITGMMGGNISVASAAMADITSQQDRAKGMGMIGAGIGLGFVLGPMIGGFSGLITGVDPIVLYGHKFSVYSSSSLLACIVSLLNLVLIYTSFSETLGLNSPIQKKKIHPFLDLKSISNAPVIELSLIYFLFTFAFSGFEFSLNFFLNRRMDFNPTETGLVFLYLGMIIIFVQGGVMRRISGKIPEINIARIGALSLIIGFLGLIYFYKEFHFIMIFLFFLSLGASLLNPSLSAITSLISSMDTQGENLGIFRSFGSLARALSPISFGYIYYKYSDVVSFEFSFVMSFILFMILYIKSYGRTKITKES
jgi:MFS family permease